MSLDVENQQTPTETTGASLKDSSLIKNAAFFRNWIKERDQEIVSENEQKVCFLVMLSCFGIILFVFLFGVLPMPIGYVVYTLFYPGADLLMFSVTTWAVGFITLSAITGSCGCCCCCIYCCCLAP